jgi:hypothetical protein
MARRTKQRVRNRAKAHRTHVKKGHTRRVRTRSRGQHPASKRRRVRATRRAARKGRIG